MEPVTLAQARAHLGATHFDWGLIKPVVEKMVVYTGWLNGAVRRRGSAIAPVRGRDELRNWVYLSVRDFFVGRQPRGGGYVACHNEPYT